MGGRGSASGMDRGSGSSIDNYGIQHRPGNPLEFPDEVATVDKIANGDFFPDDILDHPWMYFPDYDDFDDAREVVNTLKRAQGNPDMKVTIYRGAPSGGDLNQGDWVTLSKSYANVYAGEGAYSSGSKSKVYSYSVRVGDLSFDGDSLFEFGYWGNKLKNGKLVK